MSNRWSPLTPRPRLTIVTNSSDVTSYVAQTVTVSVTAASVTPTQSDKYNNNVSMLMLFQLRMPCPCLAVYTTIRSTRSRNSFIHAFLLDHINLCKRRIVCKYNVRLFHAIDFLFCCRHKLSVRRQYQYGTLKAQVV